MLIKIGYTNSHTLLALCSFIITGISLYKTIKFYKKFTDSIELRGLSEIQSFHIIFHTLILILSKSKKYYACLSKSSSLTTKNFKVYIIGFILYIFNIKTAWTILASVCDFITFIIHIVLFLVNVK